MSRPDDADARSALFQDTNFRWHAAGGAISMLGDQFTIIALPWLVLKLTADTRTLGVVLALISIPRALFILVGGAMVDRYSPKKVLMLTKYVNTLLLALLAVLVFTGGLSLPVIYLLALGIGLATAFSIPSATSMLPHMMQAHQLPSATSVMMGLRQLSMFVGPLLAGLLIALLGDGSGTSAKASGIGLAFALDAFSFLISSWTLSHVVLRESPPSAASASAPVWASIAQGLMHFWRDLELRTCFMYWAAVAVLIMGPMHIALPVLASTNPGLGASALGLMVGAHGAGTLAGNVLSGMWPRLRLGNLGTTLLVLDGVIGLLFIPMGSVSAGWQGASLMFTIGLLGGFMQVKVITWIQRRVPPGLIGRSMSLFMFIFMGLVPISSAATGWVMRGLALWELFAACGAALVFIAVVAAVASPMRRMHDAPGRPA